MNKRKLHIFLHYYPGKSGQFRLRRYLQILCEYCQFEQYDYNFTLFAYETDNITLELAEIKSLQSLTNLKIVIGDKAFSEVPTLNKIIVSTRDFDPSDWVIYAHVKGSSYEDQNIYLQQSIDNLKCIFEAILHENFSILEEHFDAIGCNLAMGVFDRYSNMKIHYSGNFFAIRARTIQKAGLFDRRFYEQSHRHLAERFLSDIVSVDRLFNLCSNYIIIPDRTLVSHNKELFRGKMLSLCEYSQKDFINLKRINSDISNFFYQKQMRYSMHRPFWKLRREIFSILRPFLRYKICVLFVNIFFPWYNCELYRYNLLPDSFELLKNASKEKY